MATNYMIIGYGWRADFYYRIARLLPEQFSICAGVLRTEARAKEVALKEGIFATADLDQALERKPDFAVLCVPRDFAKDYLVKLMEKGILSEIKIQITDKNVPYICKACNKKKMDAVCKVNVRPKMK